MHERPTVSVRRDKGLSQACWNSSCLSDVLSIRSFAGISMPLLALQHHLEYLLNSSYYIGYLGHSAHTTLTLVILKERTSSSVLIYCT